MFFTKIIGTVEGNKFSINFVRFRDKKMYTKTLANTFNRTENEPKKQHKEQRSTEIVYN